MTEEELLALYLGQDSVVGAEDPAKVSADVQRFLATPPPDNSWITNRPVGSTAAPVMQQPAASGIADWISGLFGGRPGTPLEGSPRARRDAGERIPMGPRGAVREQFGVAPGVQPRESLGRPNPSQMDSADRGLQPDESAELDRWLAAGRSAPAAVPEGPIPPAAAPSAQPSGLAALIQQMGLGGGAPAGNPTIDRMIAQLERGGVGGGGRGAGLSEMRQLVKNFQANDRPLTVPEQTQFDRSAVDKWLELAAPKEPAKRGWRELLMDIGLGMTMAGGSAKRGWGGVGQVLAGGAEAWGRSNAEQKQLQREYEKDKRNYAGARAQSELGFEQDRVRRADELNRLKLDVDRANRGDAFSMLKVQMEIPKAEEEARRGNASLGMQKLQILSNLAMNQERLALTRRGQDLRFLGAVAAAEGRTGGGANAIVELGGQKIRVGGLPDDQVAMLAVGPLVSKGGIASFVPGDILEASKRQAREELFGRGGDKNFNRLSPAQQQKEIDQRTTDKIMTWLRSDNPEAKKRLAAMAAMWRSQVRQSSTLRGLAGNRADDDEELLME